MENIKSGNVIYVNNCNQCGKPLKFEWNFCPFCTKSIELETFICSYCQHKVKSNWNYCTNCKNEVKTELKNKLRADQGNEWLRTILKK